MSACMFISANIPLKRIDNPHHKMLSINEALKLGVELDDFILGGDFDRDEPDIIMHSDYNLIIENGIIDDGGAEDNFSLYPMEDVEHYSKNKYGMAISWHYPTEGRVKKIAEYIKELLTQTDMVSIWYVWLTDYDTPIIKTTEIKIDELSLHHIKTLENSEIWSEHTEIYYGEEIIRPTYYRLKIIK